MREALEVSITATGAPVRGQSRLLRSELSLGNGGLAGEGQAPSADDAVTLAEGELAVLVA